MKSTLLASVFKGVSLVIVGLLFQSCMSMDTPSAEEKVPVYYNPWMYDFANEVKNPTDTITIVTDGTIDLNNVQVEIPPLKYNKELLFLLSQDDSHESTLCYTWAAINGRPIGTHNINHGEEDAYFYHIDELLYFGMRNHPYKMLGKTLGCTDGAGNEVRFNFSMTIMPFLMGFDSSRRFDISDSEEYTGNATRNVNPIGHDSSISWNDARYMINYGVGVAFHDVLPYEESAYLSELDTMTSRFKAIQQQLTDSLGGRKSKMLCEPNGEKSYLNVAKDSIGLGIKVLTAQGNSDGDLFPAQPQKDLHTYAVNRIILDDHDPRTWLSLCDEVMEVDFESRKAVCVGVHNTCDSKYSRWLIGINDKYGKDGSDIIWMPSQEEYYEYNYYRQNRIIDKKVDGNKLILTITLPTEDRFYYPATTINLVGVDKSHIVSVDSDDQTQGMSYANYEASYGSGFMINIDCRRYLQNLVEHIVQEYSNSVHKKVYQKWDAEYFANMLKPGTVRDTQLNLCQ